jgi:hypothetical protein|nr:strawberry notch family protein [Neorhizobium tomejilense]
MAMPDHARTNFDTPLRAAMEVLARDLKAMGPYPSRSLSFEGVEYEILEHELTGEQARIYDSSKLLLPIWTLPPHEPGQVRRLQVDDVRRIVGRVIAPDRLVGLCRNFGIEQNTLIAPKQVWASLVNGSSIVGLAGDMTLHRVRVMSEYHIERAGFTDGMGDWLRSIGLFSEMINWNLRFFVPTTDEARVILTQLMQRHRLVDTARRS